MGLKRQSEDETDKHLKNVMIRMFELKLKSGSSVQDVRSFLDGCLSRAIAQHKVSGPVVKVDLYGLAAVLRSWHSEAVFLRPDGSPRPLQARGLRELVAIHFSKDDFPFVYKRLIASNLLKRHGARSWLPAARIAVVPKPTTELLSHMAEGVGRLAETVMRNTQTKRKEDLIFERGCKVFRLPTTHAKGFREYLQKQGMAFVTAVDDWLESRTVRAGNTKRKTCAAGAFAFGYIDDDKVRRRQSLKRNRRARRITRIISATHPSTPAAKSSRRSSSADPS